jgi:hypothetical protein
LSTAKKSGEKQAIDIGQRSSVESKQLHLLNRNPRRRQWKAVASGDKARQGKGALVGRGGGCALGLETWFGTTLKSPLVTDATVMVRLISMERRTDDNRRGLS